MNNLAMAEEQDETEVPDPAITPDTKIKLDGTTNWLSRNSPAAAASFRKIQLPTYLPSPASIWVNLKRDVFCFVHEPHNSRPGDVLQYLSGANGLAWPHPNSGGVLPSSHWFFRIRNLALIATLTGKHLGYWDRAALAFHPSLQSLTHVLLVSPYICKHLEHHLQVLSSPISTENIERLPLKTFLLLRNALVGPCGCESIMRRLAELDELRHDRPDGLPHIEIKVELEVYWVRRPDIEALIAVVGDSKDDDLGHSMSLFARWTGEQ